MSVKIGVIGYSAQSFNEDKAKKLLLNGFEEILEDYQSPVSVVSGFTNLGIPKLAYEIADENNWKTVGVACKKAYEFDCYPVDEEIIVGSDWGDESERFLQEIDVLLRVGGGEQAMEETKKARKQSIPVTHFVLNSEERDL